MMIFAHAGEEHATTAQTSAHYLPEIIGVCAVMIIAVLLLTYFLSRSKTPTSDNEEET